MASHIPLPGEPLVLANQGSSWMVDHTPMKLTLAAASNFVCSHYGWPTTRQVN